MAESTTHYWSTRKKMLLCTLVFCVIGGFTSAWLLNSTAGARLMLGTLEHYTGIQSQGVSGNLAQRLHIQHMSLRSDKLEFVADDVDVQWQPRTLLQQHIRLDQVHINFLELALAPGDDQPVTLPARLQLPDLIRRVTVSQLTVLQFKLATLTPQHEHIHPQQFSDLQAEVTLDTSFYSWQFSGTTPWGHAALNGKLATTLPYNAAGQIEWQGLALKQDNVTIPEIRLNGTISGNLSRLQVQAQLNAEGPTVAKNQTNANGKLQATLTPFSVLPIESLQVELASLNPASFYRDAPAARLTLNADFKASGAATAPVLSGHFSASNDRPAPWDLGGVPVIGLSSDLTLSEQKISWKATRIELDQGGSATGRGEYAFPKKSDHLLPDLFAQFDLHNVNLLKIDSRLKKTHLSGLVVAEKKNKTLDMTLDVRESDPGLDAQVLADASLNKELTLTLKKMEIKSRDAILTAHGVLELEKNQEFALEGEANNFNPARWINVPDGHLASHYKIAGQLQKGWRVDAQVFDLSGQFAGQEVHGISDFQAEQNRSLTIRKLDLAWGKNHLTAQGDWQLATRLNPALHDQLQIKLALPDLAAAGRPFEKILPVKLQGSVFAEGVLSGNAAQPSGHLTLQASQVAIPDVIYLDHLQGELTLADGAQGKFDGKLDLTGLSTTAKGAATGKAADEDDKLKILQLHAEVSGVRHAHSLQLNATLPQQQQLAIQAEGDLSEPKSASASELSAAWAGRIYALNLTGPLDFRLQSPFNVHLSSSSAQMEAASWQGKLGRLNIQKLNWSHGQLASSGQFQDVAVARVLKLMRGDVSLKGDMLLDAAWQFNVGQQVSGQIQVRRTSGDLNVVESANGHAQSIALGMQKFLMSATLGAGDLPSNQPSSREPIAISLEAQGSQLGLITANLSTYLNRTQQGWALPHNSPLSGQAALQIKDIRWMSQFVGPGFSLHGELDANARLAGTLEQPDYRASISGNDLQIALTELGILFPNGRLDASIDGSQLRLNSLKFSQNIKKPPRHDNLDDLNWLGETGVIESSGTVDIHTGQGAITTHWQKFPFMQSPGGWLVASGQAQIAETNKTWNLTGQLVADAAYFSVPKQAAPRLSSDVVVLKKNDQRSSDKSPGLQTSLDFTIGTGKKFIFVGRGLDTRLDGEIRIRGKNGGAILATGTIQTDGGTYEGYGQKLAIDRGILNFQGPIDNPGLNVRAIRRGLPVEAGVEVIGTVDRPEVHLISEPNVPDPDKLSWMVLGRASDQMAGSEAALLMSAAGAIFGGDNGSNVPSTIAHSFGLEGLSFGTVSTSPESQLPVQTVAGTINSTSPADQVFSVGKRITPNIVLSIERSLMDASNGLKLTWQLTRQFSIIGRAGTDTAIDGQYTFSFDSFH